MLHNNNRGRYHKEYMRDVGMYVIIVSLLLIWCFYSSTEEEKRQAPISEHMRNSFKYTPRAVFQPEKSTNEYNYYVIHETQPDTNNSTSVFCLHKLQPNTFVPAQQPMYYNTKTNECMSVAVFEKYKYSRSLSAIELSFITWFCILICCIFCAFLLILDYHYIGE